MYKYTIHIILTSCLAPFISSDAGSTVDFSPICCLALNLPSFSLPESSSEKKSSCASKSNSSSSNRASSRKMSSSRTSGIFKAFSTTASAGAAPISMSICALGFWVSTSSGFTSSFGLSLITPSLILISPTSNFFFRASRTGSSGLSSFRGLRSD